jgi:polyisoprenoid-binding protein YceI
MILRRTTALALLLGATHAQAEPAMYRFDRVHTQIFFSVSHLGYSQSTGRLHVKGGWIRFDPDDWPHSAVEAVIDVDSLDMGDTAWNDKLRSSEFFATHRYPEAQFVSRAVEQTGPRTGVVHGTLSLLGVRRPLDLRVTFNRAAVDPFTLRFTIGFSATAELRRTDYGMTRYVPEIGDPVTIRIEVEGVREHAASAIDPRGGP